MFHAFFLSTCLLSLCVFALAFHDKARGVGHETRQPADHQKRIADDTKRQENPRQTPNLQIRRSINYLSESEVQSLRLAMQAMHEDRTFEKIASFHGRPGLCPVSGIRRACCVHGSPAFSSWHRIYMDVIDNELARHGSSVAFPYWDWVPRFSALPGLFNDATFFNPRTNQTDPNPFYSGQVVGVNVTTIRDPQPSLFNTDYFYNNVLLALEQTNFCQFETQLEMVHNAIHSRLGGRARFSMASLDNAAFDPVFYLHHCNVDRLRAIWQALQKHRKLPDNDTSCVPSDLMTQQMKPFATDLNTDEQTKNYSRPVDTSDYRTNYGYEFDSYRVKGMTVQQLEALISRRRQPNRTFASFQISSIGTTADMDINLCDPNATQAQKCDKKVGEFSVFGGETEMPFTYERPYLHEITKGLRGLGYGLNKLENIKLDVDTKARNGRRVDALNEFPTQIMFVPGTIAQSLDPGLPKSISKSL